MTEEIKSNVRITIHGVARPKDDAIKSVEGIDKLSLDIFRYYDRNKLYGR